jgi:hypothetical protein
MFFFGALKCHPSCPRQRNHFAEPKLHFIQEYTSPGFAPAIVVSMQQWARCRDFSVPSWPFPKHPVLSSTWWECPLSAHMILISRSLENGWGAQGQSVFFSTRFQTPTGSERPPGCVEDTGSTRNLGIFKSYFCLVGETNRSLGINAKILAKANTALLLWPTHFPGFTLASASWRSLLCSHWPSSNLK